MGAADRIAETILRMGDIRAQGLQRSAEIQARAQQNNAQIWSGALQGLSQIPVDIQKAKVLDTENQIRQNALTQQKKQQDDEFNANQIYAYVTRPDPDGSIRFDENKLNSLTQKMSEANVNPETQQRVTNAFKQGNAVVSEFRQQQLDHQVKVAKLVLGSATPDNPLTPTTALTTLKWAQANGIASTDDVNKFMAGLNQGHSPEDLFKAIIQYGTQPKEQKFGTAAPGSVIYSETTGQPVAQAPERPPAPGAGQHVINGQLIGPTGERIGEPVPEQVRPPTPKSLTTKAVLLDGKPTELVFDPADGSWKQGTETIDPKRIRPIPPASQSGGTSTQSTPTITPGSPEYKTAQDLASGKLTFPQFRTLVAYGRDTGKKMAIYQMAAELNPEFNPAQFELGYKMASNPGFRNRLVAINALGPVIDQIDELSQKVGNGDSPAFNKILQGAKFQMGSRPVTSFRQLQTLLGDEVGNALGVGTGSDLKTKLGLDLVNPNLGPKQFADTMLQLRSVLDARKAEILKQMGMYAPDQTPAAATPAPAASSRKVGDTITYQGRQRKVVKVYPDGSVDLEK
jgi:hypothetical protein